MSALPTPQEQAQSSWLGQFVGITGEMVDVYREFKMVDPDYARRIQENEFAAIDTTGHGPIEAQAQRQEEARQTGDLIKLLGFGGLVLAGVVVVAKLLD